MQNDLLVLRGGFLYVCSIQNVSVLAQNKAIYASKLGPKSNMLKYKLTINLLITVEAFYQLYFFFRKTRQAL